MAKVQILRGTKTQYTTWAASNNLSIGELAMTTDTQEVFVGDGTNDHLIGRVYLDTYTNIGNYGSVTDGNLFYATDTNLLYIRTGSAWEQATTGDLSGMSGDLDDIDDGTTYARVLASQLASGQVHTIRDATGSNDVTGLQVYTHITDNTGHREISDGTTGTTDLWSASKINTELNSKNDLAVPASAGNVATLNASGQVTDSTIAVDDGGTTTSDLWTGSYIDGLLDDKADKVSAATATDIATLDSNGNLTDSGYKKDDAGIGTSDLWSATKIQAVIDSKIAGLSWESPASLAFTESIPISPTTGDKYIIKTAGNDTIESTVSTSNDIIIDGDVMSHFTVADKIKIKTATTVAVNGIYTISAVDYDTTNTGKTTIETTESIASSTSEGVVHYANGAWSVGGVDSIAEYNGSSWDFKEPKINHASMVADVDAGYTYNSDYDTLSWTQFTGAGQITAGTGLAKDGNIINANLGAGVKESPSDEIGLDLAANSGLELTSQLTDGQVKIKPDVTTGTTVAPITLNTNGAGITVDNSTIVHSTGQITVASGGITSTEINSSIAGDGLQGGSGSALAVDVSDFAGTGLEDDGSENLRIATSAVGNGLTGGGGTSISVSPDSTTGATISPLSVGANGAGMTVDNNTIVHTTGTLSVGTVANSNLTNDSVTVTAGDGLQDGGEVDLGSTITLNIDVSDFTGTGLEDDGSENLQLKLYNTLTSSAGSASVSNNPLYLDATNGLNVMIDNSSIKLDASNDYRLYVDVVDGGDFS